MSVTIEHQEDEESSMSTDLRSRRIGAMPTMDVHLLVIIHGLWGSTKHLNALESTAIEAAKANGQPSGLQLRVLKPESNTLTKQYDGLDVCASRVAWEVEEEVKRLEVGGEGRVKEISVAGYSCGGLIARYMISLLHARSFFGQAYRKPRTFSCIATPHLGMVFHVNNFWDRVARDVGWMLLGRTGAQLYLKDGDRTRDGEGGLLERMVEPDSVFVEALDLFPRAMIFANACQDRTVPYPTAAINLDDPFVELAADHAKELDVEVDEDNIVIGWGHRDRRNRYGQVKQEDVSPSPAPAAPGNWKGKAGDGRGSEDKLLAIDGGQKGHNGKRSWWRVGGLRKDLTQGAEEGEEVLRRPGSEYMPSPLKFRWPWNLLMYAASPVLFAVGYPLAITVFVIHTIESHARVRRLTKFALATQKDPSSSMSTSTVLREEGLSPMELEAIFEGWTLKRGQSGVVTDTDEVVRAEVSKVVDDGFAGMELDDVDGVGGPRIVGAPRIARRSSEDTLVGSLDNDRAPFDEDGFKGGKPSINTSAAAVGSSSSDLPISRILRQDTSASDSAIGNEVTIDSSATNTHPDRTTTVHDTTLRLLPTQRRMVTKWNRAISGRVQPVETHLTFYPRVRNAHAVICCRDLEGGLYPEQEAGRGVIRRWAGRTVR